MARPLRIEFSSGLYHVTSRGDGREDVFLEDSDRKLFFVVLAETINRFNWMLHAYCLMDNHYHLLIETPDAYLSKGMRHLNGAYTQRLNRKHRRVGHVFQGRYKAIIVQKDSYLLELARYIVLNPVRACVVRAARDWAWRSYRATAGLCGARDWLMTDWILSAFSSRRTEAITRYRTFVAEGKNHPLPWAELSNQIYLGTVAFIEDVQSRLQTNSDLGEIPRAQRRARPKPLDQLVDKFSYRDEAMFAAYAT